jgi:hypothetical protein
MLDFTELPPDGNDFELLTRELLFKLGLRPFWSGKGPDGGRDLVCDEPRQSVIVPDSRRWLVQCKHNAHSGSSVGIDALDNVVDSCTHHAADGYLLVCSTHPSAKVVERLEGISRSTQGRLVATYWDAVAIERLLLTPTLWPIAQRFFPTSAPRWQIFATDHPNRWVANYDGFYFHLSNRIGSDCLVHFPTIEGRLRELRAISLPKGHSLRLRAIYRDDKNAGYVWFVDYMLPVKHEPAISQVKLREIMRDEYPWEDGQVHKFDFRLVHYSDTNDHYDADHYDYYLPYISNYYFGTERPGNFDARW